MVCVSVATGCKHLSGYRVSPTARKLGVTEVPLDVVNLVSHATESRLRSLLEKVSLIAQHRSDGGKARALRTRVSFTRPRVRTRSLTVPWSSSAG